MYVTQFRDTVAKSIRKHNIYRVVFRHTYQLECAVDCLYGILDVELSLPNLMSREAGMLVYKRE